MATSLVMGIISKNKKIVTKPPPKVLVNDFGPSSINLQIYFWIQTGDNLLGIKSNLAAQIKKAFDKAGVKIPFPIQTIKLDEDDRSFLKTMDSLKKGIIPEPAKVPGDDVLAEIAEKTSMEPNIPHNPFDKIKSAEAKAAPVAKDAGPAQTQPIGSIEKVTAITGAAPTPPPPPKPKAPPPTHM
jgi:hypothetical protein